MKLTIDESLRFANYCAEMRLNPACHLKDAKDLIEYWYYNIK